MANERESRNKRKAEEFKHSRGSTIINEESIIGKISRIAMKNFMCHDALQIALNPNVNFIVGRNGSGKSAILTALTVGLGAKANVTNRGTAVKDFVKKGKNIGTIEVTLINKGCMAYKHDLYGDLITVIRTLGKTNSYKIKNWRGDIVSTKRDELEKILYAMNIQVNNPISILNQDVSKTFLLSSKSEEKYELFMKATRLDVIGDNYREAMILSKEANNKLQLANEVLSKTKAELNDLKEKIKFLNEVDVLQNDLHTLQMELQWAIVISQEGKLQCHEEDLQNLRQKLKELEENSSSMESKDAQITEKIQQLQSEVQTATEEVESSAGYYEEIKNKYIFEKEQRFNKMKEWRIAQNKIKRLEEDINALHEEIQRLESGDKKQDEKNKMKQCLVELQHKLDEVEAMLHTKQTDLMHLETNKMSRFQEVQSKKFEIDSIEARIRRFKQELHALKQQSDNELVVFGPNIPRLLKRIEEEHNKKRFKRKPCGPLGAYMKVKDLAWAPAIESILGAGCFSTFCADNSEDAKILTKIIEEVYLNERMPPIVCSKFFEKVHDVSQHCTRSSKYINMLEAMVITDPVVANCLIDQWEIECVLLIPTSQEACEIMSDINKVPRNCRCAVTQHGDIFYPDPNYRSYGAKRGLRAKFLQVSTTEAIRRLEEKLDVTEKERNAVIETYKNLREETERAERELADVTAKVTKLRSAQSKFKATISDLTDKIEACESIPVVIVFHNEVIELEKRLPNEKVEEKRLNMEVQEMQTKLNDLEIEVQRCKDLRYGLDVKINQLKENIRQLQDEKRMLYLKGQRAISTLDKTKRAIEDAVSKAENQRQITNQAVEAATKYCPRINTERTVVEIQKLYNSLKGKTQEVQRSLGSKEELSKKLEAIQNKFSNAIEYAAVIEKNNKSQMKRLRHRKKLYEDLKKSIGFKVNNSFSSILALRKYKGSICIDHVHKTLILQVSSQNDTKGTTSDTRCLSGGERSYSTVAFMLALWDSTNLPFYFLDEFDVFMDKVNRRVIMDILLDYTKTHPQCQFAFLTPLDTSNIEAEDFVTIHQLAPPERS